MVGAATVKVLSERYASRVEIRAGVRNPDKAEALKSLSGVSVVRAEMGTAELETTLKGVDSLFIVTPGVENRAELASATAVYAKKAGVKHLVVVSILTADKQDTTFGKEFGKLETEIKAIKVPFTILRLGFFVENYFGLKESISGAGIISSPADPTKPFGIVVTEDIGKAAAAVLVDPSNHVNKTYNIISDHHSYGDVAAAFEEALEKKVTNTRITSEDAKKGLIEMGFPEWRVSGLMDFMKLLNEGNPALATTNVQDFQSITGERPTDFKSWLTQVKGTFLDQ